MCATTTDRPSGLASPSTDADSGGRLRSFASEITIVAHHADTPEKSGVAQH